MRSLVIEHDPLSTPERVGEHLERRGLSLEPFIVVEDMDDPEVGVRFPERSRYDVLVLMGSPWSVYDPRIRGWLEPELSLIRSHLDRGAPMLGICFGAQAMSAALGGEVFPAKRPEYGWGDVVSRHPAIAPGPWFQFHHDEFTLPPGAEELAWNESGVQAFRVPHGLAVQFHPEISPQLLASWYEAGGDEEVAAAGFDPARLLAVSESRSDLSRPNLERLLDWWLEDVVGASRERDGESSERR